MGETRKKVDRHTPAPARDVDKWQEAGDNGAMNTTKDKLHTEAARAASGLTGVLMRCGLSETAAKWISRLAVAAAVTAALTAGVLTLDGCSSLTDEQIQSAHNLYHVISGKPCIIKDSTCK